MTVGLQTESQISTWDYDVSEWNFPVSDKERADLVLKGSVREGKINYLVDKNNTHSSYFY